MTQEKLRSDLLALERKVKLLAGEHQKLKQEIGVLKTENDELRSVSKAKDQQIGDFQNRINISKIVSNIAVDEENTTELKKTIDNYIREIDKCLANLSR